jgi:hypothetical protein
MKGCRHDAEAEGDDGLQKFRGLRAGVKVSQRPDDAAEADKDAGDLGDGEVE